AGCARARRERGRGVVLGGPGGRARVPPLHASARLPRLARARRAALRRPRADPLLAARAEPPSPPGLARGGGRRPPGGSAPGAAEPRVPLPCPRAGPRPGAMRVTPLFMSAIIEQIEQEQFRRVPRFGPGDRVRVHFQVFEGIVIARRGKGARETFTVRKQSFGVGVERTFPVHSPKIERLEIVARG